MPHAPRRIGLLRENRTLAVSHHSSPQQFGDIGALLGSLPPPLKNGNGILDKASLAHAHVPSIKPVAPRPAVSGVIYEADPDLNHLQRQRFENDRRSIGRLGKSIEQRLILDVSNLRKSSDEMTGTLRSPWRDRQSRQ